MTCPDVGVPAEVAGILAVVLTVTLLVAGLLYADRATLIAMIAERIRREERGSEEPPPRPPRRRRVGFRPPPDAPPP